MAGIDRLNLSIDQRGEVPVWKQIYEQIKDQIVIKKTLPPTRKIPPSRELAEYLGVSRPTVQMAYVALAKDGFLETNRSGTMVASVIRPDHGHFKEYDPDLPQAFRKHPLPNRWLNAEEIVEAVAILWDSWPNCSWAYEELKYVLNHYEGDFHGDPAALSNPRV